MKEITDVSKINRLCLLDEISFYSVYIIGEEVRESGKKKGLFGGSFKSEQDDETYFVLAKPIGKSSLIILSYKTREQRIETLFSKAFEFSYFNVKNKELLKKTLSDKLNYLKRELAKP